MQHLPIKTRLTDLVRATFIGFVISVIVIYLNPELQNTVAMLYGLLAGKNGVESYIKNKDKPKE